MDPGTGEQEERVYDLADRTARFGEEGVRFARGIRQDAVSRSLIDQIVRAGTSIGANHLEADDAESGADFRHKIALCRKESKEASHWLRMLVAADESLRAPASILWKEARELNRIFGAILRKR